MGTSVAGQIRIDLLSNAAQFKAGMREAGRDGMEGFRQEFDRKVKSFNTEQARSDRRADQGVAWYRTFHNGGDGLNLGAYQPLDEKHGQQLRNEVRAKSMLPWGNTLRTEMSREAAMTAAAIGDHKLTLVKKFRDAAKEIGHEAANAGGLGGVIGQVASFGNKHPLLAASALGAGYLAEQLRERQRLALEVHDESVMLGQSAEDTSRMKVLGFDPGMMAKFQKSMSDQGDDQLKAFRKLKLNPDDLGSKPLIESLREVGEAFDKNVKNAAERTSVAMHLFGKSGASVIATLAEFKEKWDVIGERQLIRAEDVERAKAIELSIARIKNKMYDAVDKGLSFGKGASGFKTISRAVELALTPVDDYSKTVRSWQKEDAREATAGEREQKRVQQERLTGAQDRAADSAKKAAETMEKLNDKMYAMRFGAEAADRAALGRDLAKQGLFNPGAKGDVSPVDRAKAINELESAKRERDEAKKVFNKERNDSLSAAAAGVPVVTNREEFENAERKLQAADARVKAGEKRLRDMDKSQKEADRTRGFSGSPSEIRNRLRGAGVRDADIDSILRTRNTPGDQILRADEAARAEEKRRKEVQDSMGRVTSAAGSMEDPAAKLQREMAELNNLWNSGELQRGRTRDDSEKIYWDAAKKYMRDYFNEAHQLDIKGLHQQLQTPTERWKERASAIDVAERSGQFKDHPEDANRARQQNNDEARSRLGIKDAFQEHERARRELDEARKSLTPDEFNRRRREMAGVRRPEDEYRDQMRILEREKDSMSPDEFERRRKRLRQSAAEGLAADDPRNQEVRATPALQLGHAETYSTIVQAMLGSTKDQLQREANAKLDSILRAITAKAGQQVEIIGQ